MQDFLPALCAFLCQSLRASPPGIVPDGYLQIVRAETSAHIHVLMHHS